MKKQVKRLLALALVVGVSVSSAMTSFAGEWRLQSEMWTYQNDDGSYATNCWQTIDGKSYHFNEGGMLDIDLLTLDGYTVDETGAWIESIPQKSQAEIDKYWQERINNMYKEILIVDYESGLLTEAQITEFAISSIGEADGQRIMEEIRKTYIYGSKGKPALTAEQVEEAKKVSAKKEAARQALRDAVGVEEQQKAVYAYLKSQDYETSLLKIIDRGYKYKIEYSSSPKAYVYTYSNKYILTMEEGRAILNYMTAEDATQIQNEAGALIEIIERVE